MNNSHHVSIIFTESDSPNTTKNCNFFFSSYDIFSSITRLSSLFFFQNVIRFCSPSMLIVIWSPTYLNVNESGSIISESSSIWLSGVL